MEEISVKEIAVWLSVSENTLRRWIQQLDDKGYPFERMGKKRCLFLQEFGMLREIKRWMLTKPLEEACEEVLHALQKEHREAADPVHEESDAAAIHAFDAVLSEFPKQLYWEGEDAVRELMTAWRLYKAKRLGKDDVARE